MAQLYKALEAPLEQDLLPLSAVLQQKGVMHRISEQHGRQVLEVTRAEDVAPVTELYRAWRSGQLQIELQETVFAQRGLALGTAAFYAPVMLMLILACVLAFIATYLLQLLPVVQALSFIPFSIDNERLFFYSMDGQYWRLLTPVFLHFGWLHIVFNCLWLWELGRRVEVVVGHFNALMICMVIALVSNVCQYVYGGPGLFGGMSGVVYGLLGFAWVAPLLHPAWQIQPQPAVMLFMVGWLVACLLGVIEALGFGAIANAAHLAGILAGGVLGAIFALKARWDEDTGPPAPL